MYVGHGYIAVLECKLLNKYWANKYKEGYEIIITYFFICINVTYITLNLWNNKPF